MSSLSFVNQSLGMERQLSVLFNMPSNLRHKLEETSSKGIFIGYGTCEKGYRTFNYARK